MFSFKLNNRVAGRPFFSIIITEIVIITILVILSVLLVMFLIIRYQIIQGKAIVGGHKVNTSHRVSLIISEKTRTAGYHIRDLMGKSFITSQESADNISVVTI